MTVIWRPLAGALLCTAAAATSASAQEFVRQTLLVAPLQSSGPSAARTARQVGAGVRSRLARLTNRRDVYVIGTDSLAILFENSGFRADTVLDELGALVLSRRTRSDEAVTGTLTMRAGRIEVHADLRVPRDWRMRQPLEVTAATAGEVADSLASQIIRARAQMTGLRRCENAGRAGNYEQAARHAETAIAGYRSSALARTCLAIVLRFTNAGSDSIVAVTSSILAIDSMNIVAAVMRARHLSERAGGDVRGAAWRHVIRVRPDSVDLALEALDEMMRMSRPALVLEAARTLVPLHNGDMRFRRLAFRAHIALGDWKSAAALGDSLDAEDAEFRGDSTYAIRHVESLRLIGDTLSAIAKSARSVRQHPGDLMLYVQYVKLIGGETAAALPRGLAAFPGASELHVLSARAALSTGKRRDAIAALGAAVNIDSLLTQGFLQMAELWFDEHQPDSALAVIARAPRTGDQRELLRMYAVNRGRQLVRAGSDSNTVPWLHSLRLFALADTVESREDSRGLIAATTLQLARNALVAASKSHECPDVNRANETLELTASALTRGVGEGNGSDELKEAFGAMRSATDTAMRVYCNTKVPPGSRAP
jgi:hypothetical protein